MQHHLIAGLSQISEEIMSSHYWLEVPRAARELDAPKRVHRVAQNKELTMKLMLVGMLLAVAGESASVVEQTGAASQWGMIHISFIFGSFGALAMIGLYNVTHPREIVLHALAAVPTAGAIAPVIAWLVAKTFGATPDSPIILCPIATAIGIGGPYLVRNYGKAFADAVGKGGIGKVKSELGVKDDDAAK